MPTSVSPAPMTTLKCTAALPISPVCLASAGSAPQHLQTWISLGGGQALWDELAADLGIKPLLAAHTGSRSYLVATERIDSMSALAGRKAHVAGLARDVARGLGLEPVSIAPGQLSGALRRGEILAAECGGAIIAMRWACPPPQHIAAGTSIHRNGTALSLAIRRDPVGAPSRRPSRQPCRRSSSRIPAFAGRGGSPSAYALPRATGGAHLAARCRTFARHPPRRRCGRSACRRRRRPNHGVSTTATPPSGNPCR